MPISDQKKRRQRLSRLSAVVSADELDLPEECRGWGDDAPPRQLDVAWRKVCATGVFPVVSKPPKIWAGSIDSLSATTDWGSGVGDSWGASNEEVAEKDQADRKLAMFKSHVVNIAKAAGIDEDEFIEWLTGRTHFHPLNTLHPDNTNFVDEYTLETTMGTKLNLLRALATEIAPPGYRYSDLTHVCYRLRHGPTQDTNTVDDGTWGQKPSRLQLMVGAVVELATLRDPEAVAQSPEWNIRTETMAYVVDAYLDAHFTQLCVEAMESGEDCEEKFFNVPEDFQDGFRGRWWEFMAQETEAAGESSQGDGDTEEDDDDNNSYGNGEEGDSDKGDEDDDSDACCTCVCW